MAYVPDLTVPDLTVERPAVRRRLANGLATVAMIGGVLLALLPLVLILYYLVRRGLPAMNWEFLTHAQRFSEYRPGGGFLHGLVGTLIMVGLATAISVPLGVLSAVYLVEYGKTNFFAKLIRFFSDVMTGVPSVFVGVFIYTALVLPFGSFGAIFGGAALAVIMLPIVVRSSEEMLKLVPSELKDASYALGAAKWQTVVRVVLPTALPGITTGVMLAVARAAGETAPLILTALGASALTAKLTEPIASLPRLIFAGAQSAFATSQARAWAGALELVVIVLIFTLIARIASSRSRLPR